MNRQATLKKPDASKHADLGREAADTALERIPRKAESEVGGLAEQAVRGAGKEVQRTLAFDKESAALAAEAGREAERSVEGAAAQDSQNALELARESILSRASSALESLEGMRGGREFGALPPEMRERIRNAEWFASRARDRLEAMEGLNEQAINAAGRDLSLAMFSMSTIAQGPLPADSKMVAFHNRVGELRGMGVGEREETGEEAYARVQEAAVAASLEARLRGNAADISFARKHLGRNSRRFSAEEKASAKKALESAEKLNQEANEALGAGKMQEAEALLSQSGALAAGTIAYMGALGEKNAMRAPIREKEKYAKLAEKASGDADKIAGALAEIAGTDVHGMEYAGLNARMNEKFSQVQELAAGVAGAHAEAELLRFDASRAGYTDKRLERVSNSARALIDAGKYSDANELLGIGLLYKETWEKSAYAYANERKGDRTLEEARKRLAGKFKIPKSADGIGQARKRLGRILDNLCPPAGKEGKMGEEQYRRELAAAKGIVGGLKKGAELAKEARDYQREALLSLGEGQEKKPGSAQSDHDVDLISAYGIAGNAQKAAEVLDSGLWQHVGAEREEYTSSLNLEEKLALMAKGDAEVLRAAKALGKARGDLAEQSAHIMENVALEDEGGKEGGIYRAPRGEDKIDDTALAVNGMVVGAANEAAEQEAKLLGLHEASSQMLGKTGEKKAFPAGAVSKVIEAQQNELDAAARVERKARGMAVVGRSASTYLIAYRAGESRFWGGAKTEMMRDYVPRAMNSLYAASKALEKGNMKEASVKYSEAQDRFMEGFAFASGRRYDDKLIVEYKVKTSEAFDVVSGREEGDAEAALLAMDATNLTVQTQYRGKQAFEGGLEHLFVSLEDGRWLNLLGPVGVIAYNIYNREGIPQKKSGEPKFRAASMVSLPKPPRESMALEERLERIGYVPYEERVKRMEEKTARVLSGKTSLGGKRAAAGSVERDARQAKESYDVAQSLEDGLFTAAMLLYQPLFFTEIMRDTARNGADTGTAILGIALATGKIGQARKAVSEFSEAFAKGMEEAEALSVMGKAARHLKDPIELLHLSATSYLVVHGLMGAHDAFAQYSATGDMANITAGVNSIAFQIPIITGFTLPLLTRGRMGGPGAASTLLGRMREGRSVKPIGREAVEAKKLEFVAPARPPSKAVAETETRLELLDKTIARAERSMKGGEAEPAKLEALKKRRSQLAGELEVLRKEETGAPGEREGMETERGKGKEGEAGRERKEREGEKEAKEEGRERERKREEREREGREGEEGAGGKRERKGEGERKEAPERQEAKEEAEKEGEGEPRRMSKEDRELLEGEFAGNSGSYHSRIEMLRKQLEESAISREEFEEAAGAELGKLVDKCLDAMKIPEEYARREIAEDIVSKLNEVRYLTPEQRGNEAVARLRRHAWLATAEETVTSILRIRFSAYREWLETPEGKEYTRTRSFYLGNHAENADGIVRGYAKKAEGRGEKRKAAEGDVFAEGGVINIRVGTESMIEGFDMVTRDLMSEFGVSEGYSATIRTDLANTGFVNSMGTSGRQSGNLYLGADYMIPIALDAPMEINQRLARKGIGAFAVVANTAKMSDEITIKVIARDRKSMELALNEVTEVLNSKATGSPHFQEAIEATNYMMPGTFPGNANFRYGIVVTKVGPKTAETDFAGNAADANASRLSKELSAREREAGKTGKETPAAISYGKGVEPMEVKGAREMEMPEEKAQDVSIVRKERAGGKAPERGRYLLDETVLPWPKAVASSDSYIVLGLRQKIVDKNLAKRVKDAAEKGGKEFAHAKEGSSTLTALNNIHTGLGNECVSSNKEVMIRAEVMVDEAFGGLRDAEGRAPKIGSEADADILLVQRGNNPTLQIFFTKKFVENFRGGKPLGAAEKKTLMERIEESVRGAEERGATYYDTKKIRMETRMAASREGFGDLPPGKKIEVARNEIRKVQVGEEAETSLENYSRKRDLAEDSAKPMGIMLELLGGGGKKTFEQRVRNKVGEARQQGVIDTYTALFGRKNLDIIVRHVGVGKGKYRIRELPDLEFMLRDLAGKGKFGKGGKKYAEGVLGRIREAEGAAGAIRALHEFGESNLPSQAGAAAKAAGKR